jgi:hypothetical protein
MKALHSRLLVALPLVLAAAGTWALAPSTGTAPQSPGVTLVLDTEHPGRAFDRGAVGLSVDANELGTRRLSVRNRKLVRLMRLLGPSVLRIGGISVDLSWWTRSDEPAPAWATNTVTPADLYALRGLLRATGWRVVLGLDLGHFEPPRAADEANYARRILGARLLAVEIGNEPNSYGSRAIKLRPPTYGPVEYLSEVRAYEQALEKTAPGVPVYGPALSTVKWLSEMGTSASMFAEITQHYYPSQPCQSTLPASAAPLPTSAELLSPTERQQESETLSTLTQVGALAGRPVRIGETGTGACMGNSSASPDFASALWALDWTLRAASMGASGLNFHGHLGVCGSYNQSPICASSTYAARVGSLTAQPEYYGLLAASRLEGGRFLPTSLTPAGAGEITTWATLSSSGRITIAIDDLAATGVPQTVAIAMRGYSASEQLLTGPSTEARSGIALGDAGVTRTGRWRPRSTRLARRGPYFRVLVRPGSAAIVTLSRLRSRGR